MSQQSRLSLRQRQREVLAEMIKSAVPMERGDTNSRIADDSDSVSWKIIVFDNIGRSILAPLFKVKDLRELGVTLHLNINVAREPIPGAPVLYFCAPTEENITRIAQDCSSELYEWVYVNFTEPVHRKRLESFAEQLAASGKLQSIRHIRVVDRTLSYVALSADMFTLMMPRTLYALNSRHTKDAAMEELLSKIAQGVTHAVLSTQMLPVIAYARSGAAEEVAKRVTASLHEMLQDRSFVPTTTSASLGRPMLLIVDRTADLPCALHHPFSYRGLLMDTLGMQLNKIETMVDGKEKTLELDPDTDAFFKANAGIEFGSVGSHVEAALADYKKEVAQYSAENNGTSGSAGYEDTNDASVMSKMLANAPKLAEKKRSLDAHMTLAYSILSKIKEQELDGFHGVEYGVLTREGLDSDHFKKLMQGALPIEDKQRLFLLTYFLSETDEETSELEQYLPFVTRAPQPTAASAAAATASSSPATPSQPQGGPTLRQTFPALQYIKHLRSWSMSPNAAAGGGASSAGSSSLSSAGWGFAQTLAKGIAASLKGSHDGAEFALTRLVDALMQDTQTSGNARSAAMRNKLVDTVAALDPRSKQSVDISEVRFHQAIVFVVGGGNVNEFDNLKSWESRHPRKTLIYGCTEMARGGDILEELSQLGAE